MFATDHLMLLEMLLDEQCDYCNDEKQINDDDMIVNLVQNKLQNGQYFLLRLDRYKLCKCR